MAAKGSPYHHGDLPATLVRTALEMLDRDDTADLSLRAVARAAGVSRAAPYRHFSDRSALLSAVAAVGYQDLTLSLAALHPEPSSAEQLADLAVAYVDFALDRPGLFRVMFASGCDAESPERVAAVEAIHAYLHAAVARTFTTDDPDHTATAMWSLVHGLAFLHLDGKLDQSSRHEVRGRVRATALALITSRLA